MCANGQSGVQHTCPSPTNSLGFRDCRGSENALFIPGLEDAKGRPAAQVTGQLHHGHQQEDRGTRTQRQVGLTRLLSGPEPPCTWCSGAIPMWRPCLKEVRCLREEVHLLGKLPINSIEISEGCLCAKSMLNTLRQISRVLCYVALSFGGERARWWYEIDEDKINKLYILVCYEPGTVLNTVPIKTLGLLTTSYKVVSPILRLEHTQLALEFMP